MSLITATKNIPHSYITPMRWDHTLWAVNYGNVGKRGISIAAYGFSTDTIRTKDLIRGLMTVGVEYTEPAKREHNRFRITTSIFTNSV
jgi:hypothetical protein